MSSTPWVRLWVSDWRGSPRVRSMSLAERGLYIDLLALQADSGPFVWDPARLARGLGCTVEELEALWPAVSECFETGPDGRLSNPKMDQERSAAQSRRDAAVRAGQASARSTHVQRQSNAKHNGRSTPSQTPVEPQAQRQAPNPSNPIPNQPEPEGSTTYSPSRSRARKSARAGSPDREPPELDLAALRSRLLPEAERIVLARAKAGQTLTPDQALMLIPEYARAAR